MFVLGNAADSTIYVEPQGTHDSDLENLVSTDEAGAFGSLAQWSGVEPTPGRTLHQASRVRVPRLHGRHESP